MNMIAKTGAAPYFYAAAGERSRKSEQRLSPQGSKPAGSAAVPSELPADWQRQAALQRTARDTLAGLLQQYPGIHVTITEEAPPSLQQAAACLWQGKHLLLSRDFLNRMANSAEDYAACKSALEQALRALSGKTASTAGVYLAKDRSYSWSAAETEKRGQEAKDGLSAMLASLQEKNKKTKDFRYTIHPSSYSTRGHYASLVQARSKGEVQTVIMNASRTISSLRKTLASGDDSERMKASRAIRSLQKLLHQGGKKIRKLNEEKLVELRRKRAAEEALERKEKQLRLELQKRRRLRRSSEYALLRQGVSGESFEKKKVYDPADPSGAVDGLSDAGMDAAAGLASGGGTAVITAADVTVSEGVAF